MTTIAVCCVAAIAFALIPGKRDMTSSCTALIAKIPENHLEGIARFHLYDHSTREDAEFWIGTNRIRGLFSRLRNTSIFLRVVYAHFRDARITKDDALFVWKMGVLQMWFTLICLPEAFLCLIVKDCPHVCARAAFEFYYSISLQTITLCSTNGSPKFVRMLEELL